MTNKEKEKILFQTIKEVFKSKKWKFNSNFAFKTVNDFFFDCTFVFNPKEDKIWIELEFKPMILDEIFWDIIEAPENKKMPLSFRSNAAFKISAFELFKSNAILKEVSNQQNEVSEIERDIENRVNTILKEITNVDEFFNYISKAERLDYNTAITYYILKKDYELAKKTIEFCRCENICSGYGFGTKDFYDMAEHYIRKIEKEQHKQFNWKSLFSSN